MLVLLQEVLWKKVINTANIILIFSMKGNSCGQSMDEKLNNMHDLFKKNKSFNCFNLLSDRHGMWAIIDTNAYLHRQYFVN